MKIKLDKEKLAKAIEEQHEEKRNVAAACHTPSIAGSKSTDIFLDLPPVEDLERTDDDSQDAETDDSLPS